MAKRRINSRTTRGVRKPVIVEFRRSDGSIAKFKATKIVTRPKKVNFKHRKRK